MGHIIHLLHCQLKPSYQKETSLYLFNKQGIMLLSAVLLLTLGFQDLTLASPVEDYKDFGFGGQQMQMGFGGKQQEGFGSGMQMQQMQSSGLFGDYQHTGYKPHSADPAQCNSDMERLRHGVAELVYDIQQNNVGKVISDIEPIFHGVRKAIADCYTTYRANPAQCNSDMERLGPGVKQLATHIQHNDLAKFSHDAKALVPQVGQAVADCAALRPHM